MNKQFIAIVLIVLIAVGLFTAFTFGLKKSTGIPYQKQTAIPTETLLGGDRDEHGCIPSAGYSWCESKQRCLRSWEEPCSDVTTTPQADETEVIKTAIKQQIVAEHGPNAENLVISVSKISGNYAQGGASAVGEGGGMWFAAKVNNNWELVWDGNGVIKCEDLTDYPDFPTTMIPECYDEAAGEMIIR